MSENKQLKKEEVHYTKTAGNLSTVCKTCNRDFVKGEMISKYTIFRNEVKEQWDQCSFCSQESEEAEKAVTEYEAGREKIGVISVLIFVAWNTVGWRMIKAIMKTNTLSWWTYALGGAFISVIIHLITEWGYRLKYGPKPDRLETIIS